MEIDVNTKQNKLSMPMAIIIAGVLIAGAIYFSSIKKNETNPINGNGEKITNIAPIGAMDRILGDSKAKVVIVMYEDFQCPFCAAVGGSLKNDSPVIQYLKKGDPSWTPFMPDITKNYIDSGKVSFVFRDWAFLGDEAKNRGKEDESTKSAEAARCAGDQGKFWEFHDYLYSHQNGENQGGFSNSNLKTFAKNIGLDTATFDQCLDSNKYEQAVNDSKIEGTKAGVTGTPKGFILRDGKVVSTIDGAEPLSSVKSKIDAALK